MDFDEWAPFYARIIQDFGFDPAADERAAQGLARILRERPFQPAHVWQQLQQELRGRDVFVVGAGDDAATSLQARHDGNPIVAADGATTACLEAGLTPALIVSDLDGRVDDEVAAVADGSHILVHAHGDNVAAVRAWLPRFEASRVGGTCQTRPIPPLRNEGGFTDGDRACFLAHALGARRLRLVGFRFDGAPGRYSGTYDATTKPRKLQWAKRLLDELKARGARIEFE